jgi:hypothetical protein
MPYRATGAESDGFHGRLQGQTWKLAEINLKKARFSQDVKRTLAGVIAPQK